MDSQPSYGRKPFIFPRGLYGYVWVNMLTLSPPRVILLEKGFFQEIHLSFFPMCNKRTTLASLATLTPYDSIVICGIPL